MKLTVRVSILLIVSLIPSIPFVWGHTVNIESYEDSIGDGYDYVACFSGELVPMTIPLDIESVNYELVSEFSDGDIEVYISVSLFPPHLPHQSYTIEVTLDFDNDPTTGESEPICFYNGGGSDYDFGVEVNAGQVVSTWVDEYYDGVWVRQGAIEAELNENGVVLVIPPEVKAQPIHGTLSVQLITEGGMDSAPNIGEPRISFEFMYTPDLNVVVPDAEEGAMFFLDARASMSWYGDIIVYEWDFDNDGVYEVASSVPNQEHMFPDDGLYLVPFRITDVQGISATNLVEIEVQNTAPSGLEIILADGKVGDPITLTGVAVDQGDDQLDYIWDFGDGSTDTGQQVTHIYDQDGFYTVKMTVSDGVDESSQNTGVEIEPLTIVPPDSEGGRRNDVYIIGAVAGVLAGGAWFYGKIVPKPKPEKEPEEEPKKPGDYCEEHPEVVEQENSACWDAQMDLDTEVGDMQDKYDEYLPRWQSASAEITRLITEWDATVQLIKYWTGVEDDIIEDAEKVQAIAGLVTNAAGKAKTAVSEGGEAVMKEIGEDLAKDVGKSVLGEIGSTIGQVLELEDWAVREIGLSIAKGLTGVDPEKNAINLRKQSESTMAELCSWMSDSEAWNQGRRPPDTIDDCLDFIHGLQNSLDQAKQAFEDAVKDFKCVMCDIPEHISEEIEKLEQDLEKWEKTFTKLKEEIEKRLEEAKKLYKDKGLYESPYEYLDKARDNIERADKALG